MASHPAPMPLSPEQIAIRLHNRDLSERKLVGLVGNFTCPVCRQVKGAHDTHGILGSGIGWICKACEEHCQKHGVPPPEPAHELPVPEMTFLVTRPSGIIVIETA